jgi:hypothetical protein
MEGQVVSGEEFNRIYKGKQLIKLTNIKENHNGFKFHTGLNIDTVAFNPKGECKPGGLYFCEMDKMISWLNYGDTPMVYYRYVLLPKDSRVYIEKNKFKADKLILTEKKLISDIMTEEMWITAIRNSYYLFEYIINNQTEAICLAAVQKSGLELEYVKDQTEAICLVAAQQNGLALEYVNDQTEAICLAAVQEDGLALIYVKDQTEAICLAAVQKDGLALQYVLDQTEAICSEAVKNNGLALKYARDQTEAICWIAVKEDNRALKYVLDQTENICLTAIRENGLALKYIKNKTEKICLTAVRQNRLALKYVKSEYKNICFEDMVSLLPRPILRP